MDFNRYFKSRQGELVNGLKKIVQLESPTADKKAVDACASYVVGEFKKSGSKPIRFPQKEIGDLHVIEYAPGALKKESEQILVLVHLDTVWPVGKITKMPFYIAGNKIFGPGTLDMKAGIVMILSALTTLHNLNIMPRKKIAVFINSAEETGYEGGHGLIRDLARKSSLVLCLEPSLPGGDLKLERKGRTVVRLETRGKAAHGGTPEKGVSAVEELLIQLGRLKKIKTGETTVNIGLIGGGEKANIVPCEAWAVCDIRFWRTADREKIRSFFKELKPSLKGAKVRSIFQSTMPPMEKTRASQELFARAAEIAAELGLSLKGGKSGGGSDASIASNMGLPTIDGLGPDGEGIHAEHEHVLLSSLVERTALLTRLLSVL